MADASIPVPTDLRFVRDGPSTGRAIFPSVGAGVVHHVTYGEEPFFWGERTTLVAEGLPEGGTVEVPIDFGSPRDASSPTLYFFVLSRDLISGAFSFIYPPPPGMDVRDPRNGGEGPGLVVEPTAWQAPDPEPLPEPDPPPPVEPPVVESPPTAFQPFTVDPPIPGDTELRVSWTVAADGAGEPLDVRWRIITRHRDRPGEVFTVQTPVIENETVGASRVAVLPLGRALDEGEVFFVQSVAVRKDGTEGTPYPLGLTLTAAVPDPAADPESRQAVILDERVELWRPLPTIPTPWGRFGFWVGKILPEAEV